METHIRFLQDLLNLVNNNQDATVVAIDQNDKSIVITLKKGVINYISYKDNINESAISLLDNLTITDYSIKKYIKLSSKSINLSSSNEIIKLLTASCPESLEYYQEQSSLSEDNSISENIKQVSPIEPELTLIPENALQIVSSSLQQILGPISNMIYEDVLSQFSSVTTRKDLADLLNLIMEEIEDEEIEYQKQFLTSISDKLGDMLSVETSK